MLHRARPREQRLAKSSVRTRNGTGAASYALRQSLLGRSGLFWFLLNAARSTPPVDRDRRALDRLRLVRAEEQEYARDRFGRHPLAEIGVGAVGAVFGRVNRAVQDAVYVDVRVLQLGGEALGQADDGALAGAVGGDVLAATARRSRRGVYDRAAPLLAHHWHNRLRQNQRCASV